MVWAEIELLKSITLPNAQTWTCMVFVLIIMLFVRFAKPLQWRHWDLLLLFMLTIPLLFLRSSQERRDDVLNIWCSPNQATSTIISAAQMMATPVLPGETVFHAFVLSDCGARSDAKWMRWYAFEHQAIWRCYLWLLIVTALLLFRSLFDLGLEQRREFRSNVSIGGMAWLTIVMMAVMILKSLLPDWRGIPQPQNESLVIKNLTLMLAQSSGAMTVVAHVLSLTCHLLIVVNLVLIGWLHFRNLSIGVASALLYLLMPYTALLLLNTSQVLASMFIMLAITCYRQPMLAGLFLGLGTGFGFYPAILVPLWTSFYFRRGHWRFLITFLTVCTFFVVFMIWKEGLAQVWQNVWSFAEWQAWKFAGKPTADGLWNTVSLHFAYRIPLLIAFLALMITSAFWPYPKHLGQLISWSATLILGVQFWYADGGGSFILWYLPLVILQTFRPSLTDVRPAAMEREKDWLSRGWHRLTGWWRPTPATTLSVPQKPSALAG
ncbi:MAG TPA: hypothetical protein PLN21_13470 [Gemmatales bacterium]|nr:hypothetical protein [Gemmatales bacterium]